MTGFIVWLHEMDPLSAAAVGGAKMGRLAELFRLGLKVPRGFTITVDAYAHHFNASGLNNFVDKQLSTIDSSVDRGRLAPVTEAVKAMVEQTAVEPTLAAAITDAYAELAFDCGEVNQPVAVRSSATGEDSALASFAGIFDTYLGMSGEARVLEAVRRCWASLFSTRALSYRLESGRSHRDMPMAIGVLELIPARASGVAFSVNPVSGKRDRVVIEGTWGWGEAVVQGVVTPDRIEVGKSDRRVLSYNVADKRMVSMFDYAKGEVVETEMPVRFRNAGSLSEDEVGAVVEAVCVIEDHYGYPVDVEWVIERGRRPGEPATIVQTRPVTGTGGAAVAEPGTRWDLAAYAAKYAFGQPS